MAFMFWFQCFLALAFFATAVAIWARGEDVPPIMGGAYAALIAILFAALALDKLVGAS